MSVIIWLPSNGGSGLHFSTKITDQDLKGYPQRQMILKPKLFLFVFSRMLIFLKNYAVPLRNPKRDKAKRLVTAG